MLGPIHLSEPEEVASMVSVTELSLVFQNIWFHGTCAHIQRRLVVIAASVSAVSIDPYTFFSISIAAGCSDEY